jgi:(R,R)-butanediol dehydrogenase/meso-butanediol dehydrogenase/diacetyl reductase
MKAQVWLGKDQLVFQDVPTPKVGDGQVLIKVKLVGVCGSDPTIYHGKHLRAKAPLIMGHEALGEIIKVGAKVTDLAIGNKVVFNPSYSCGECEWCQIGRDNFCKKIGVLGADASGAYAEYIVVSGKRVYRLPDNIPDNLAVLAEPLAVSVHAVNTAGVKPNDNVAVIGGGTIGLLAATVAKVKGARKVMVLEVKPFRLKVIEELGFIPVDSSAETTPERIREETNGAGVDVVMEASGSPAVVGLLTTIIKRGGTIGVVGIQKQPGGLDLRAVMYNELKMFGSFIYNPRDFDEAVALITSGKINLGDQLVTHMFPLEKAAEAIITAETAPDALKVVINCHI